MRPWGRKHQPTCLLPPPPSPLRGATSPWRGRNGVGRPFQRRLRSSSQGMGQRSRKTPSLRWGDGLGRRDGCPERFRRSCTLRLRACGVAVPQKRNSSPARGRWHAGGMTEGEETPTDVPFTAPSVTASRRHLPLAGEEWSRSAIPAQAAIVQSGDGTVVSRDPSRRWGDGLGMRDRCPGGGRRAMPPRTLQPRACDAAAPKNENPPPPGGQVEEDP